MSLIKMKTKINILIPMQPRQTAGASLYETSRIIRSDNRPVSGAGSNSGSCPSSHELELPERFSHMSTRSPDCPELSQGTHV